MCFFAGWLLRIADRNMRQWEGYLQGGGGAPVGKDRGGSAAGSGNPRLANTNATSEAVKEGLYFVNVEELDSPLSNPIANQVVDQR
eukprot:1191938-Prorocentrum_minimum.AAC.8